MSEASPEGLELRAKAESGALDKARLKAAAFLGHGPATEALDIPPTPEWEHRDTDIWISRLRPVGKEAFVRAVIAIVAPRLGASDSRAPLEAAEAWVHCPCEDHRKGAAAAFEAAKDSPAALAASCASQTIATASAQELYKALRNLDPATTPKLVAAALVPWLLGAADPLAKGVTPAAPVQLSELSPEERSALDVVVKKLKADPGTLVRELAHKLTQEERADLSRRILERRSFDN